ncbi:MAG: hypothetical protein FXF54_04230 [Kosmotoga sp.]|nr:MAG: hypothetical protein FXF54_04230 [Kosmotoga sp.]
MRNSFIVLFVLILSVGLASANIKNDVESAYNTLYEMFKVKPDYTLVILDTVNDHPRAVQYDSRYRVLIPSSGYYSDQARHEMAHVFLMEYAKEYDIDAEALPIWYHELVASWFTVLDNWELNLLPLNAILDDFTEYTDHYPDEKGNFYSAVESFAIYLSRRYDFETFVKFTINKFSKEQNIKLALDAFFDDNFEDECLKWKLIQLIPYSIYLLFVVLMIYLLLGRRDRKCRGLEFDPRTPEEVQEERTERG